MALPQLRVPRDLGASVENLRDKVRGRPIADLRQTPRTRVDQSGHADLYRYDPVPGVEQHGKPLLLIPPLAAPALAFDLRRGCSVVEYFVNQGRPVYLVDYGPVSFGHRGLGIEHWVDEVLPWAVQRTADEAAGGGAGPRAADGAEPVHAAGWSLGGIFTMLTTAAHEDLPIATATAIASPFDLHAVPILAIARPINRAGVRVVSTTYKLAGGIPAPLTRLGFQLSAIDKYLTKPISMLMRADDRDFLAQLEAVDRFMDNMYAYPGRTFGQLYHVVMRTNEFATGTMQLGGRAVALSDIEQPVLVVAGLNDTLAPLPAVTHLLDLVPGSADAHLLEAPGGHLGVLTGRAAAGTTWPGMEAFYVRHDG
ncbi:alpha/beta hydrolase [Aeromicrobium terrae]|uniref:Alpha/beta hydrolase n=1 Tax=Aeromicrobium terrae TaxID=2498846 RepID=A0A5C8NCE1_9ACTN|nr:alpha/beta hydrolase [Aeromicrobium terrae]TXL56614.1 alpha/beta hydrolase [Aeromicrobium terrae]